MANRSLGSLTIDLVLKTVGLTQGADKAERELAKRAKSIERGFTNAFKGAAAAAAGFVAGLATVDTAIRGFMGAVDAADRVDELSARLGISTERLSTWGYAAKLSGTDLESLTSALQKFSKTAAGAIDADSKQAGLFEAIGVQVKDAQGNLRSLESLLPDIADAFKTLNNETLEAAVAQELFGRSGAELLEFLNRGSDGIEALTERARELGIEIGGGAAGAAAEFKDRVDDLRAATQGWLIQLAGALLPAMTDLVEEFTDFVVEGGNVEQVALDIADAMRAIADTAKFFGGLISQLGQVRSTLAGVEQSLQKFSLGGLSKIGDQVREILPDWLYRRAGERPATPAGSPAVREMDPTLGAPLGPGESAAMERRLNRFLSGGGSKSAGGKSEAQREAEQLQKSYESLMASMRERIALFDVEGEAAKVAYDLENGALKMLDAAKKQELLTEAQRYDALVKRREADEAAYELAKQETERLQRAKEDGQQIVSDLQFELELMRMNNAERATAIQLRGLESEAVSEYGDAIAELNRTIEQEIENARFMDGVRSEFSGFITDVVTGTETISDAFKSMLDNIAAMITQRIAENWVEQLFGQQGSSGAGTAGGNWLGSLLGAFFGGGRASGGWTSPNTIYEVNERGLEMATVRGRDYLLTGSSPVEVTPNSKLGMGGSPIVQNFYNPVMADRQTDAQRQREAASRMQRQMARA